MALLHAATRPGAATNSTAIRQQELLKSCSRSLLPRRMGCSGPRQVPGPARRLVHSRRSPEFSQIRAFQREESQSTLEPTTGRTKQQHPGADATVPTLVDAATPPYVEAGNLVPLEAGALASRRVEIDLSGRAGSSELDERIREPAQSNQVVATADVPVCKRGVLGEILGFAVPALGSVLADPLMSLVDTACVGQYSSLHLAALAPNTSIFNLFFQLFTFLGCTTTNLIASNSIKVAGLTEQDKERRTAAGSRVLAHSMLLAVFSGLACTVIMLGAGPQLLTTMGASPETLGPALSYLQIRALASPAVMVANVAQGACLGQQDSWTPLKVFATSGVVNLVLDLFLVNNCNMGITGAAIATTFAQVVAASYFVWYCWQKGNKGEAVPLKWNGLPTMESLRPFWEVANTLLTRTMFTCIAYTSVSTLSASLGFLQAATHQVALQVFWFFSYVPESISLTAQSLIARDMNAPSKARVMTHTLMRLGGGVGVALAAGFAGLMLGAPWLFSNDAAIHAIIPKVVVPGAVALYTLSLAMTFDGVSIGSGKLQHLPRANLTALVACLAVAVGASNAGLGLAGTWMGLSTFMITRLAAHCFVYAKGWKNSLFGNASLSPSYVMA